MGYSASDYLPTSQPWHLQRSKVFIFGDENGLPPLWAQRVQAVPSAQLCTPSVSLGWCSPHTVLPSWPLSVKMAHLLCWTQALPRGVEAEPTETVRDTTLSLLNHSLLTPVGWDREVTHHIMPTEPLPEPGPKSVAE